MLFNAWKYQQWPIASTRPKDEYGRERERHVNYLDEWHVPTEYHAEGNAIAYIEALRMPYNEIMDMMYDDFVRVTMLHKAVTMTRPEEFKGMGDYYMDNTRRKYGL